MWKSRRKKAKKKKNFFKVVINKIVNERERKWEREGNGKLSKGKKKQVEMNEWRENCLNILKNTY